jgi:hypothetical protein
MKKSVKIVLTLGVLVIFILFAIATSPDIEFVDLQVSHEIVGDYLEITNNDDFKYQDTSISIDDYYYCNSFGEEVYVTIGSGETAQLLLSNFNDYSGGILTPLGITRNLDISCYIDLYTDGIYHDELIY